MSLGTAIAPPSQLTGWTDPDYVDFDDLTLYRAWKGHDKFEPTRTLYLHIRKKYGNDPTVFTQKQEAPVYEEGKEYTNTELSLMADEILREDRKRELCRKCDDDGIFAYGDETGEIESKAQYNDDGSPALDENEQQLYVEFPELQCENGHRWFQGEGKARGIDGPNPILFDEHLQQRRKREIYTAIGTPDPSITQGMYNRTHPQGRKVNTDEQRKKNGASWYR